MNALAESLEVRRCAACGEPALTVVRDWQHVFAGIRTPSRTFELACQACGTRVTLEPQTRIRAVRVVAWLLVPAVFPSLILFARARRLARAWTDNPVVPGATEPAKISATGDRIVVRRDGPADPRDRTCRCGAPAPCVKILRKRMCGIPIGTCYDHTCTRCGQVFSMYDGAGVAFPVLAGLLLIAVGVFIVTNPPGSAVGAGHQNQLFGVGLVVLGAMALLLTGVRIRARVNHPPVV